MSTVTNPLSNVQLDEIFNELMNNKEIKKLLQTMEEVKKGNLEGTDKENINNFAKKMREMSEMVPGSEELMKNIEVISVLHEKIFSYASRFRLYSLEFWNLYSILAEIRDKGDEPLSQFEQMIVKSTQPILWESNRTLKLSWMCCCFLSQYYGSEEDKEVIKDVMLTWESKMNEITGKVEVLEDRMFGGMDRTNIAQNVFKEVNGTTFNDEVGTKFNDEVVDVAAVHFHKLKTGPVMDAIDMVKSSSSTPEEIAQARKVIVTEMSDNNTIIDREAYMGLAEARHGPQVLTHAIARAQQEKKIRFREQKPADVLKINLDGLKPEKVGEVVTNWNLVMTEILGLAAVNTASRDASLAAENFCDHVLEQGFSTLVRKEMEDYYTEFGSDKTQEQNIENK